MDHKLFSLALLLAIATQSWCVDVARFSHRLRENTSPACRDENGKAVDWYIGYKFPHLKSEGHPFDTGYAYAYFTSEDVAAAGKQSVDMDNTGFIRRFRSLLKHYIGFPLKEKKSKHSQVPDEPVPDEGESGFELKLSKNLLTDPNSVISRTLSHGYDDEEINVLMYNDDPWISQKKADERREQARLYRQVRQKLEEASERGKNGKRFKPKAGRAKVQGPIEEEENEEVEADEKSVVDEFGPNSDTPKYSRSTKAHAKGVVMMNEADEGIWLTHSFPRFPPPRDEGLSWPESTVKYGQTFMCVSYKLGESAQKIIKHLVIMNPNVYDFDISDALDTRFPDINNLNPEIKVRPKRELKLRQEIKTRGGQILSLFSKSTKLHADIYSQWIDSDYDTNLFAETWRQGTGTVLNSTCPAGNYHVNNVKDLQFVAGTKVKWTYSYDHSKWAISDSRDKGLFCIADSNRVLSQFKRGSGAVCIICRACWSAFSSTIQDVEPCPVPRAGSDRSEEPPAGIDWQWVEHLKQYFQ